MGDKGADPAFGFHKPFLFQNLIDLGNCQGIEMQLCGKLAYRWELRPVAKLARENALLELLLELQVQGNPAIGVKEKHSVVVD